MINLTFCVSNLTQISPAIYKLVLFIQTVDRVPFIRRTILKRKEGKGKKKNSFKAIRATSLRKRDRHARLKLIIAEV